MKKLTLVLAIITVFSANIFAQDESTQKFKFGLKAGANYSNIYDSEGEAFTADG
jgi:hypothetical protein